jgi:hypothetical protein
MLFRKCRCISRRAEIWASGDAAIPGALVTFTVTRAPDIYHKRADESWPITHTRASRLKTSLTPLCPVPGTNIPAPPRKHRERASGVSSAAGARSRPNPGSAARGGWSMQAWLRTLSTGGLMIGHGVTHGLPRCRTSDRLPMEDEEALRPPSVAHGFVLRRAAAAFGSAAHAPSR